MTHRAAIQRMMIRQLLEFKPGTRDLRVHEQRGSQRLVTQAPQSQPLAAQALAWQYATGKHYRLPIAVKIDFAQQGTLPARQPQQRRFIDLRPAILMPTRPDLKIIAKRLQALGQRARVGQPMPVAATVHRRLDPGSMRQQRAGMGFHDEIMSQRSRYQTLTSSSA